MGFFDLFVSSNCDLKSFHEFRQKTPIHNGALRDVLSHRSSLVVCRASDLMMSNVKELN